MVENNWIIIRNDADIEYLMDTFGYFHDGCIKELKYVSGQYVKSDMGMYPINDKRILNVIFQRQWPDPSVIEMEFRGLSRMNLAPADENYIGDIMCAYMAIHKGLIYWVDWECFDFDKVDNDKEYGKFTWIAAKNVRWRITEEYIGAEEIYVSTR